VKYTYPHPLTLKLQSVVSRKTHVSAGIFDINLPLAGPTGIECRNGVHTLIFTFGRDLDSVGSVSVTEGSATPDGDMGPGPNQYTVTLTGIVPNAQYITVTLNNVEDVSGATFNASGRMGVLLGDTNATGGVNATDIGEVKTQAGEAVTQSNFRTDLIVSGHVNASDVGSVKAAAGTVLPPP
jgi:hypothetical protein